MTQQERILRRAQFKEEIGLATKKPIVPKSTTQKFLSSAPPPEKPITPEIQAMLDKFMKPQTRVIVAAMRKMVSDPSTPQHEREAAQAALEKPKYKHREGRQCT